MTPKDIHKIFIPQKIFIFLKTLKGIEIQNFEPQNGASPLRNENIIVPPPLHPLLADRNRGRGRPDQITEKNSKGFFFFFFFFFFFATIFFYGSKVSKHLSGGGGGGVQLFIIIFLGGGGGWGVQILISIETYIACDFSGRGEGGPDHLSLSGFAHGKK